MEQQPQTIQLPLEYEIKIQHLTNQIQKIEDIRELREVASGILKNAIITQYLYTQQLKRTF